VLSAFPRNRACGNYSGARFWALPGWPSRTLCLHAKFVAPAGGRRANCPRSAELARLMRFDPPLEEGRLIRRYKRFLADIETVNGELLTIHCPNTGSMLNCQVEGGQVWFSRSNDPKRKLPGTWEIGETPQGRLFCVNTGRANGLIEEALRGGVITELNGFTELKREVAYGQESSRIDFRLDYPGGPAYIEVKSVTLGFDGSSVAAFPDAVTQRGAKHLRE